ncbi:MAG TPA: lysylphosphatidylglycerol synthase domain-containing protein [Acidimicrobiia bacterium]|nr:lysylphosphatidylglycerol synthase domain-containing protein [Acidimicrobiia bacterium]
MASRRVWFGRALSIAVVAAVFLGILPRLVDFGEVWRVMSSSVGPAEASLLAVLTAASLFASFAALVAALPGLSLRQAAEVNMVTTAVSYSVPAGGAAGTALTATMLRRLGFTPAEITRTIVTTGVWYLALRLALPVVALLLLALESDIAPEAQAAAVFGLVAVVALVVVGMASIWWERPGRRLATLIAPPVNLIRRWIRRPPLADLPDRFIRFRDDTSNLVADRWVPLTVSTLGYNLALFGVFAASLDIIGVGGVGLFEAFAVFVVARQVTALPITPGSAGIVELALIGGLGLVGADATGSAAAVLLFRFFTYLLYLPLGVPMWWSWRRRLRAPTAAKRPHEANWALPGESPPTIRHAGDLLRSAIGLVLVVLFIVLTRGPVGALEENLFRLVNGLPDAVLPPAWVLMQAGMLFAVAVASLAAVLVRRRRLALDLLLAGSAAWILAKVVKAIAGRPRPGALLTDVILRADAAVTEVGFVTGHAAVAAAMATVAAVHVKRPFRWLMWAGVAGVGFGRTFVGAHLPWDIVGGVALGWSIGSLIRLLRGTPAHLPEPSKVRSVLESLGFPVLSVEQMPGDLRRAVPFRVVTPDEDLFVKVIGRDQRDADLLGRLWRFVAYREPTAEPPFATPNRQLEHEGLVLLMASRAGVRVPDIRTTARVEPGTWLLAMDYIDGRTLDEVSPDRVDAALLDELWTQVRRMGAAGIAHRDLRPQNLIVDDVGRPWLLGFGSAAADAFDHLIEDDLVQTLVVTAATVGPERAVAAAARHLESDEMLKTSARVHPIGLPASLRGHAHRLSRAIVVEIARLVGAKPARKGHVLRISAWPKLAIGALASAFAVVLVLGGTVSLGEIGEELLEFDVPWGVLALLAFAATQVGAAVSVMGATRRRLALGRTVGVQVASAAVGMVTPPAHGSLTANLRYLRVAGVGASEASQVMAATRLAGVVVHGTALLVAVVAMVVSDIPSPIRDLWVQPALFAGFIVVVGLVLWGRVHGRVLRPIARSFGDATATLGRPGAGAMIWLGSAVVTGGSLVAFLLAGKAVGLSWDGQASVAVFLLVSALAPLSPLPGGLGVMEAGLVAGMLATGATPAENGVAAVLLFRLLTFWLPLVPGIAVARWLPIEAGAGSATSDLERQPAVERSKRRRGTPLTVEPMVHPSDLIRVAVGVSVAFALSLFAAEGFLLPFEVGAFRLVNELPDWLFATTEVLMQFGALGIVPVLAVVALVARRRRLAVDLALAGPAAWLAARVIKSVADRGRPDELLAEVIVRGDAAGGLGFLSGHAAVAACIATVAAGHFRRPIRWLFAAGALTVAVGRVYVGAHFPLDVVAGAAIGWAVGAGVRLLRGAPSFAPTTGAVVAGLRRMGLAIDTVEPLHVDARGSIPCVARTPDGDELIVKALSGDQRDADLLFRLWRFLAFGDPEPPFPTPKRQIEHEAYLVILADRAGVRVPELRAAGSIGEGVWVLAEDRIDGENLASFPPHAVSARLLRDLWDQVARLRDARIAHRDLRLANVLVDRSDGVWLIDFGFAECGVSEQMLAQDVAELLTATACRVGAARAVEAANRVLGPGALAGVDDLLQPLALSSATRKEAGRRPGLLEELRRRVVDVAGAKPGASTLMPRRRRLISLGLAAVGTLVTTVLVAMAGVSEIGEVIEGVLLRWVLVSAVAIAIGFVAQAVAISLLADRWPGLFDTLRAGFAARVTDAQTRGDRERSWRGVTTAMMMVMTGVHAVILGLAISVTLVENSEPGSMGGRWTLVAFGALGLAGLGTVRLVRRSRSVTADLRQASSILARFLSHRAALPGLIAACVVAVSTRVLGFVALSEAFGTGLSAGALAATVLAVAAVGAIGPLPGGVGVVEPGITAALILGGAEPPVAVVVALGFSALTFWLPLFVSSMLDPRRRGGSRPTGEDASTPTRDEVLSYG